MEALLSQPVTTIALVATVSFSFIYNVYLVIYRLWFSPLAKFPGPKFAAASFWYEFYYDYWLDGKYLFEVEKMHKKYEFYNEIYVTESKRRTNSYDVFCKGIDFDGSHLLTADHDLHRKRRKPMEGFFSRKGITQLQPMLAEVALHLESRFRELEGKNAVIRLDHAFSAFSGDIIGRICLGTGDRGSHGDRFLDAPDFASDWYNVIHAIVRSIPLFTGFPQIIQVLSLLPESLLLWVYPKGQMFNIFRQRALNQIRLANSDQSKGEDSGVSIFRHIANSDMPVEERTEERLAKEAQVLLGGGTASTARTIGFASYYILSRPELRSKLEAELKEPMANWPEQVPTWAELEQLPLLQGIIKESLRLSYGVMHRLPRVFPDQAIQYKDFVIPPGIPVGMSAYLMHSDPEVYPNPGEFIPERWVHDVKPAMHRSLAMAEMSLVLAVLYRSNGPKLELYETDESDVKQAHDFLIPLPKLSTKGVRALIR
ncbi:uncharacterized protein Triagg1_8205 [Trichoderma aggressivum f. europaeum]|uniref:Cytochrome P450 n=1 Tax=Trichoderma aggressivum f. europaeum TaxID=173218 RepID=A0AAE1I8S9_9HYPO|nr:hypothetical protein Triagg1_8205 [Trichoderma aggressivum f. europaeum]